MDSWDSVFGSGKIVCKTLDAVTWKAHHVLTELLTMEEVGNRKFSLFVVYYCLHLARYLIKNSRKL